MKRRSLTKRRDSAIFKKTANRTKAANKIGHGYQRGGRRF